MTRYRATEDRGGLDCRSRGNDDSPDSSPNTPKKYQPTTAIVLTQRYLRNPFVLTGEDVRGLANAFEQFANPPSFEVACRDGIDRSFGELAGLLSFDNARPRMIRSLWIRASSDERMNRARLRFSAEHAPVYLEMEGEEASVSGLHEFVVRRVEAMRPTFLPVSRLDYTLATLAALAALGAVTALGLFARVAGYLALNPKHTAAMYFIAAASCGLVIGIGWLVHRPQGILFPAATFALGKGELRRRCRETFRWILVFGSLASLAAGAIVSTLG